MQEQSKRNTKSKIALTYYDNTEWESHIRNTVDKVHGSLPQAENEIMLSEDALALLYISDPEIGMEIEVSMNQMSKKVLHFAAGTKIMYPSLVPAVESAAMLQPQL